MSRVLQRLEKPHFRRVEPGLPSSFRSRSPGPSGAIVSLEIHAEYAEPVLRPLPKRPLASWAFLETPRPRDLVFPARCLPILFFGFERCGRFGSTILHGSGPGLGAVLRFSSEVVLRAGERSRRA